MVCARRSNEASVWSPIAVESGTPPGVHPACGSAGASKRIANRSIEGTKAVWSLLSKVIPPQRSHGVRCHATMMPPEPSDTNPCTNSSSDVSAGIQSVTDALKSTCTTHVDELLLFVKPPRALKAMYAPFTGPAASAAMYGSTKSVSPGDVSAATPAGPNAGASAPLLRTRCTKTLWVGPENWFQVP